MSTYTLISSQVLGSSAASVTFSSIPSTYKDLVVRCSLRTDRTAATSDAILITLNSDTGTNYSYTSFYGSGTAAGSSTNSLANNAYNPYTDSNTATANTYGSHEFYIPNYAGNKNKPFSSINAMENNTTAAFLFAIANLYSSTTAISSISFAPNGGTNFLTYSSFYLYGI